MRKKDVSLKPNAIVTPCPQCGNNTDFPVVAGRVAGGGCGGYVEWCCGFDPTAENTDYRLEDAMGYVDMGNIQQALRCWNEALAHTVVIH